MLDDLLAPGHLLLIILVALLIFGPGKLPELGSAAGRTIREFKAALSKSTDSLDNEKKPD